MIARLEERPESEGPSEDALVRELERLRELLIGRQEEKDRVALLDQWHRQSAILRQIRTSRAMPEVDPASPYFAHFRLREGDRVQDLCLGKATRVERGLRIVDWRNAPISRIFYRYAQGEEFEEELAGRVRVGVVEARRTVTIRASRLERVEAPEGIFDADPDAPEGWRTSPRGRPRLAGGEQSAFRPSPTVRDHAEGEGLHRRLGTDGSGLAQRADKHLPDIARLIDPAQFELITRPASGFLVVRGMAGSGKTTVALHRIAFLAFDDPRIASKRTLVVVFSRALRDYVSHVLPALGVAGVEVSTFHDWSFGQSQRIFPNLPRQRRDYTPASVHKLKLHPALSLALEEQVRRLPDASTPAQVLDDWTSVLTLPDVLEEAFSRVDPDAFSAEELRRVTDWNRERHEELQEFLAGGDGADLDPEDDALLLRAWQLRMGPLRLRRGRPLAYRHVAIDEVQDFSPLEVQVLMGCLDRRGSITLAGDTQQHVMQDAGFTSWGEFLSHLGVEGAEIQTLRVSYRSTHEITRFALALLGDLREDEEPPRTTRSGPPVETFQFTDHGAGVVFLAEALHELAREEPLASVVVLAPTPEVAALYHRGLEESDVPRLRRVERQDFRFAPGIEVTEFEQVKGLEFDYVVLVDVSPESFPDQPRSRRLLHMGATRAVHQLWVTSVGPPSAIVRDSLAVTSDGVGS